MAESGVPPQAVVPRSRRWFLRSLAVVLVSAAFAPPWTSLRADPATWVVCAALLSLVAYLGYLVWRATAPDGAANLRGPMRWPERLAASVLLIAATLLLVARWGGLGVFAGVSP